MANVLYLDSPANVGFSYSKVDFIASDDGVILVCLQNDHFQDNLNLNFRLLMTIMRL